MAAKKKKAAPVEIATLCGISGVTRGGLRFTVETLAEFKYDDGRQGYRYKVTIGGDIVVVTTPLGLMEFAETL